MTQEGDNGTTQANEAPKTLPSTQAPILEQVRKAKKRVDKEVSIDPFEENTYKQHIEQLKKATDGQLTEVEYDQLTRILMFLDIWDVYERTCVVERLDSDLMMQARLYRAQIVSVMEKWRSTRANTSNFLQEAKLTIAVLKGQLGEDLQIQWLNQKRGNLVELLKKTKEEEAKKKGQTSSDGPGGMKVD